MPSTSEISVELIPQPLRKVLPYLLISLLVLIVYGNIYDNEFLFDDDLLITINSNLRGWGHIADILTGTTTSGAHINGGFFRPIQMLLYLLVFQLGGSGALAFHLLNLGLHIGNACLLYRLGLRLQLTQVAVLLGTLVWSLHPLHTEAVTYMSGTADPLFSFFCLLALNVLAPTFSQRRIYATLPLFLLGLGAKETMAMFPLLVMACQFLSPTHRRDWRFYARTWPLWMIAVVFVAWRLTAKNLDGPQTYEALYQMPIYAGMKLYAEHPLYRLYTFFATLPAYLGLLLYPNNLHMERSFSIYTEFWHIPVVTGLAMSLLSAAHVVRTARLGGRGLGAAWGFLWFFSAHGPDSGILIPMNSLFLEHWMYLPSAGLCLGIGETTEKFLVQQAKIWKLARDGAIILFATFLSFKTFEQNWVWRDPVHFYGNIFAHGENSARCHNNLALYYGDQHNFTGALAEFQQAIAISDVYAETRYNVALIYMQMPDRASHNQDIIDNLNRALQIDPRFFRAWQVLGDIYAAQGDKEKAKTYHQKAKELTAQMG